jgi:hypothetical protein
VTGEHCRIVPEPIEAPEPVRVEDRLRVLPSLEEPEPGSFCGDCGEPIRVAGYCGRCAEHEHRRDDPLRLEEMRTLLQLAGAADTHSSDVDPGGER